VTGVSTLTTYKDGSFGNNGTANAATTTWQVDPNTGRMVSKTYADNSSVGYSYNAAGQLAQSVYGGVTATYGYTADGRQNSVTYEESNQPTICYATQAFDAWGNPTVITETTTPVYWFGVHTVAEAFSYDAVSHALTGETFNYATHHEPLVCDTRFSLSLAYAGNATDPAFGNLTGISLNQATSSTATPTALVSSAYGYDSAGHLTTVIGSATSSFAYDLGTGALSVVTTASGGGDIVTTKHYNASNGYLESIVTMRGGTTIYEEDLTYPAAGSAHYDQISRKQVTSLILNGTTSSTVYYYVSYDYDSLNQLTSMVTTSGVYGSTESHTTLASESYAYDALGNRTDLPSNIMNLYTQDANGHTLTWDARGNLTGTWEIAYTYDPLNRITSATPANHASSKAVYTYDYASRRTSETLYAWDSGTNDWSVTPTAVTQYLYSGQTLLAEVNGLTGKLMKAYEWDPTKPNGVGGLLCITTYDTSGNVTGRFKPAYDANANVVSLMDLADGAVVANYSYTAFGICTATGPQAGVCLFRFGGMYWQASAAAYYDKARDVKAELGRFMQRDPSGERNSINGHAYCHNDPVDRIDPTGMADQPTTSTEAWLDAKVEEYFANKKQQDLKFWDSQIQMASQKGNTEILGDLEARRAAVERSVPSAEDRIFVKYAISIGRRNVIHSRMNDIASQEVFGTWTPLFLFSAPGAEQYEKLRQEAHELNNIEAQLDGANLWLGERYFRPAGAYGTSVNYDAQIKEAIFNLLVAAAAAKSVAPAGGIEPYAVEMEFARGAPLVPNPGYLSGVTVTFKHGARHLAGSGLSSYAVEDAIDQRVQSLGSEVGEHWGWVQVNGQWIQYRAFTGSPLPDGTVNIGTYMRVPNVLSNTRMP
jgi:RHS repeat-associated protein